jgi:DNA modification methylase
VTACACEHCGHEFDAEPEGGHRLLCGDAADADCVTTALAGTAAALCLTDPPYGLGGTVSAKNNYTEYDDSRENLVRLIGDFLPLAQTAAPLVVLTPGNGNQRYYPAPTWTMAWFTPAGVGRGPGGFCCWQPILCFGKDPKLARGKGCHPDAIVHTEAAEKNGHPCAKPIKFWCWLVERTSRAGDVIYDPFSGSGTTIVAAEMTGRAARAIEITPVYCDVAVKRWAKFTGRAAVLAGDGRTFDELAAARGGGAT